MLKQVRQNYFLFFFKIILPLLLYNLKKDFLNYAFGIFFLANLTKILSIYAEFSSYTAT